MNKASLQSLFLSAAVLVIGTVGGALIAQKIAEGEAGFSYLWFGCISALTIFIFQLITFSIAKKMLFFQLLYLGFFGFSMTWFMLALSLPIFWINEISLGTKLILALIFMITMISNLNIGCKNLNARFNEGAGDRFESETNKVRTGDDWNTMIESMKITHNIFIPGLSEKWTSVVSVGLIASMILGLNLRIAYPTFSVFAWGIPATVMASYFIQVTGSYFTQAVQVRAVEKKLGYKINSTS